MGSAPNLCLVALQGRSPCITPSLHHHRELFLQALGFVLKPDIITPTEIKMDQIEKKNEEKSTLCAMKLAGSDSGAHSNNWAFFPPPNCTYYDLQETFSA